MLKRTDGQAQIIKGNMYNLKSGVAVKLYNKQSKKLINNLSQSVHSAAEIEKLYKTPFKRKFDWKEAIRLKGRTFVDLFTYVMLIKLMNVCFFKGADFTSGSLTVYGTVLTTFAITNTVLGVKNGVEK